MPDPSLGPLTDAGTLEVETDPDLPGFSTGRLVGRESTRTSWNLESFTSRTFDVGGEPLLVRFEASLGVYALWRGERVEALAPRWVTWGAAAPTRRPMALVRWAGDVASLRLPWRSSRPSGSRPRRRRPPSRRRHRLDDDLSAPLGEPVERGRPPMVHARGSPEQK